jgi:hypothetical protein
LKNKILYKEVDESNLDINIYTIHINNGEIFQSNIKLDSVQYEIYKNQKDQDSILSKMIDRNIYESCNNISKHPNIKNFLQEKNILNDVRNYKLNKIID